MIKPILSEDYPMLFSALSKDSARSYFIRLGLLKEGVFQSVHAEISNCGELSSVMCLRKSGTLQFYSSGNPNVQGFAEIMKTLPWKLMISPKACCLPLIEAGLFRSSEPMAYIAKQEILAEGFVSVDTDPLRGGDLEELNALYDRVFDHHMTLEQMKEKLLAERGRGVVLRRDGRIVSVAQTEFEECGNALIVGVATAAEYRGQGLAEACMRILCQTLLGEGRVLWLQYDNPEAGKLYEKLGFVVADRVINCYK